MQSSRLLGLQQSRNMQWPIFHLKAGKSNAGLAAFASCAASLELGRSLSNEIVACLMWFWLQYSHRRRGLLHGQLGQAVKHITESWVPCSEEANETSTLQTDPHYC